MALHSKFNSGLEKVACGICIAPIKTNVPGPAPKPMAGETDDMIDEAIKFFRPNLLFKNFSVTGIDKFNVFNPFHSSKKGPADVTLIYLTVFLTQCLKVVANE